MFSTAELKDDKRKLIDDAVAELKNAAGDGTAAAASPVEKKPTKIEKKEAPNKTRVRQRSQSRKRRKSRRKRPKRTPGRQKKPKSPTIWPLTSAAPFSASKSSKRSRIRRGKFVWIICNKCARNARFRVMSSRPSPFIGPAGTVEHGRVLVVALRDLARVANGNNQSGSGWRHHCPSSALAS